VDDPIAITADDLALEIELALTEGSEDIRVRAWRLDQFLELGFGLVDSSTLAASSADIGEARRLIAHGCAPALASRILA
jgi:hypothetical protein